MTERKLTQLRKRWQTATGEPMPADIASLTLDRVQRAVALVESGTQVFVPRVGPEAVAAVPEGSMVDWDKHKE